MVGLDQDDQLHPHTEHMWEFPQITDYRSLIWDSDLTCYEPLALLFILKFPKCFLTQSIKEALIGETLSTVWVLRNASPPNRHRLRVDVDELHPAVT